MDEESIESLLLKMPSFLQRSFGLVWPEFTTAEVVDVVVVGIDSGQ